MTPLTRLAAQERSEERLPTILGNRCKTTSKTRFLRQLPTISESQEGYNRLVHSLTENYQHFLVCITFLIPYLGNQY